MKVFIVVAISMFAAVASAGHLGGHYGGAVSTGHSSQFRSEDNYGNYQFGYDEAHSTGSTSRREEQTNGVRRGSYSLSDADGRQRTVNYVADAAGFRATIHTNEPGVEPKDPADVLINKEGYAVAAAPVPVAAPIAVAAPAPAPVYASPAPIAAPLPAPIAVKSYAAAAPRIIAPVYAAPAAPVYEAAPVHVEAPAPRAFSYSFGSTHAAPVYAPAPVAVAAPAPIYQHGLKY